MASFSFTFAASTEKAIDRPSDPVQQEQDKLFGKDLLWVDNNYSISSKGDYVTVNGVEKLRASILRRLMTSPGEYQVKPDYGVGVGTYVKRKRTITNVNELRSRVEQQLLADPRITRASVSVTRIDDGLKINVAIVAKGNTITFSPIEVT